MTRHLGPWIALAGLFVGAGLYLGLRERASSTGDVVARPPAASAAPSSPPAPSTERPLGDIERELAAAVERRRAVWRVACWDPILARAPSPPSSTHRISIGIDAGGREILRAINDVRGETRDDVARCLREQSHDPIVVAAPGRPVSTELSIRFP